MATDKDQDAWMDSTMGAPLELVPMDTKVDHSRMAWCSIAEFLRAPKAARYPRPEDFAENRFGPL